VTDTHLILQEGKGGGPRGQNTQRLEKGRGQALCAGAGDVQLSLTEKVQSKKAGP